ncbi:MAG: hypothetical protein A2504_14870 [Bdellovibrionales bacterium RIFOXYD12_FULL_39_22]|nr:MAG: hypothetical protein A2385_10335 [Bdellovibrionales bacterium RIFOXYB1_FULL_39_21]OFZ40859.1 MAG: hypothetical protein A2485_17495 [Bdellovibrionales bacterium RIFOXYC12_FULL_39_17]OFZ44400.1 MAG: hypothetical protein A2404_11105 [Bdellovibrionales bacterium RIFOXYC1_FULL_39_130]OFZ72417.1 MAG: hypothetical protein A2451_11505 [Bdellovibrionales bacterium RIFOXYC2_FULL_39_8]OFZ74147.1 MAG: hypothetical protein A2560_03770 [Bdellovibrionales bacterium RIFOXYD1_FULL_39_84]OFZ91996.1 MAG:
MFDVIVEMEKIQDPFSGLGQFCYHLGRELLANSFENKLHFLLPPKSSTIFAGHRNNNPPLILNKIYKNLSFLAPKSKVWHATHQDSPYLPGNRQTRYILTIHDLNFIFESKRSPRVLNRYKKTLQKKIDRATHVVFISQFTKKQVSESLTIDPSKASVIYNGIALTHFDSPHRPTFFNSFDSKSKFFFSIGAILPKKNFHVLIDLARSMPEYNFILAGTTFHPYAQNILQQLKDAGLTNRFIMPGTISEEDKFWLYKNCEALLFPSLFEGFGIPVAEAMSLGRPVFLSRHTGLPEIGGPHAFYFENFQAEHMREVILRQLATVARDPLSYATKAIAHTSSFSWKMAAQRYLEIYAKK